MHKETVIPPFPPSKCSRAQLYVILKTACLLGCLPVCRGRVSSSVSCHCFCCIRRPSMIHWSSKKNSFVMTAEAWICSLTCFKMKNALKIILSGYLLQCLMTGKSTNSFIVTYMQTFFLNGNFVPKMFFLFIICCMPKVQNCGPMSWRS